MKIGILTFHRSVNNGAFMQAYALSSEIKKRFPSDTVEIVDYTPMTVVKIYSYSLVSYLSHSSAKILAAKLLNLIKDPKFLKRMQKRTAIFESVADRLPLSPKKFVSDDYTEVFQYVNDNYDALIIGSDAVWNYISRGYPNPYFPDSRVTVYKLSYAASCYGMDFMKCAEDTRKSIASVFDGFDFIGVRDTATEEMVRWSGSTAVPIHTCDPTAVLDIENLPVCKSDFEKKLAARGFDFSRPAIGMMGDDAMFSMIKKMYGDRYQIVALYNYIQGADVNLYDVSPFEWAYAFRYFKVTFTTFFHGTMLSLRNGVPLICIALKTDFSKAHTPKTLDVLQRCGLSDWYFETDYRSENFDRIKKKADELINGDYRALILERMNAEAKSFHAFAETLKTIKNIISDKEQ